MTRGQLKELESRDACTRRQTTIRRETHQVFAVDFLRSFRAATAVRSPDDTRNAFITRNRQYLRLVHVRDNVRRLERNANPLIRADCRETWRWIPGRSLHRRFSVFLSSCTVIDTDISKRTELAGCINRRNDVDKIIETLKDNRLLRF